MEEHPRLNRGSSAVYQCFISGTRSALSSWLPTRGTTLFCLCKPFSCKACDPRVDAIRRAAERSRRAAERSCRRRAAPQPRLSADCDLSYLLKGVFNAPASGVFERRTDPRHRPADLQLLILLLHPEFLVYFAELVYTTIKIPVNEFYEFFVKHHVISRISGHVLHEKGFQAQNSVVPLVGSQEQRALLVPLINQR